MGLRSPGVYAANGATSGPEFFSAATFGVAASPRMLTGKRMPRGGGRDQVGSPYTVAGRTYYPTAKPKKSEVGLASWYGAAFHGRLTANGEIYDMNHLTAAHKTMPLPSYARVTNIDNGRSLIVRVNDRGPFADDRVIDLSKRAADLLDYTHGGTAKVKVEYAGRAPLDGHDDQFLMASVQGVPGYPEADRFGQPAGGVMIAMNGPTPVRAAQRMQPMQALPGVEAASVLAPMPPAPVSPMTTGTTSPQQVVFPAAIPLPGDRPAYTPGGVAVSAYASMRIAAAFADTVHGPAASGWKSR
ncbi:MAG: septal ring lytic transglycosylase RlpA family protein [Oricola sp.]